MRHVEIGLEQVYTNVSLSRIRLGLCQALEQGWIGPEAELFATCRAVHRLLDLDLAIIEDAYHSVYVDRLQRHERLAALGQIAAGIAHELRNPLNVLKTSTYYLLQAKSAPTEKVTEHLRRLDKHIELADNVISALSNFAKMPVPNLKAFELKRCLCEALEQTPMPDNIAVICDSLDALPPVLGDVDQVRIVFTNLLRNAREALGQGGSVHIPSRREQTHVVVAIRDTGPGIPPEILSRVMEPLFTTKARGLGLGLAIAKAILEKHQGSLQVESRLGEGTTFTVRMLADPSAAASLAEGESLGGALGSENPDCGR